MIKTPLKLFLAASIALPSTLAFAPDADARHYKKRHYSAHHHGPPPRAYYYGGHRHHHSKAGKYLGVALLGLGIGYVLSKSSDRDDRYDRYEDEYYRNEGYRPRYSVPPTSGYQSAPPQPYTSQGFDFSQCQETREYQTTIFVDGHEQQAFGTACLMPDGAWVAGPMQIEP